MATPVRAIYENGHLRLLDEVNLVEGEEVTVTFLTERQRIADLLRSKGMLANNPIMDLSGEEDDTEDEEQKMLDEVMRHLPPLSELIIEERREGP